MEDDESAVYVRTLLATPDDFRAAAKVFMDNLPEADDTKAADMKAVASLFIEIAEMLEEAGVNCLAELPGSH